MTGQAYIRIVAQHSQSPPKFDTGSQTKSAATPTRAQLHATRPNKNQEPTGTDRTRVRSVLNQNLKLKLSPVIPANSLPPRKCRLACPAPTCQSRGSHSLPRSCPSRGGCLLGTFPGAWSRRSSAPGPPREACCWRSCRRRRPDFVFAVGLRLGKFAEVS